MTCHLPGKGNEEHFEYTSKYGFTDFVKLEKCYQFSSAVVMFGSILRNSPFVKAADWDDIIGVAEAASTHNDILQKEFIVLVQQAKKLYSKTKKKKGGGAEWQMP
jgi:Ca-activated chloride channel family protein